MPSSKNDWDSKGLWASYAPSDKAPWNLRRVVHLHRRAGFAATWDELQRDLKDGPEEHRPAAEGPGPRGVPEDFATFADRLAAAAPPIQPPQGLVGLPHALRPRPAGRALDLHVARPLRHQQPQGQRPGRDAAAERDSSAARPRPRSASCSNAVVRDPALLIWLDAPANRKGHPNENLARELMELFTLGIGHLLRGRRQGGRPGPDRLDARRRRVPR